MTTSVSTTSVSPAPAWSGPGADRKKTRELTWRKLLWSFLYPSRGQRIMPTISGILFISVSLGIGSAAYNTSNNILFITLSLLLACLHWQWRAVGAQPVQSGRAARAITALSCWSNRLHHHRTSKP
ncbi:MAG: hypothetical protein J6386_13085 [Candidatus Synoicihabitans palmerolidicus]|nr:hypothetical protein [Candidatus Synoicihabitans palmerolidicus]